MPDGKCPYCGRYGPLGQCEGCGAPNRPAERIDVTSHSDVRLRFFERYADARAFGLIAMTAPPNVKVRKRSNARA